jgi:hypothetical protein
MKTRNTIFFKTVILFYNIFLPIGFIFFVPGMLIKLWKRPGWKKTYHERFGMIGSRKAEFKEAAGAGSTQCSGVHGRSWRRAGG